MEYGGVKQRWVIVFSPEAYLRARKTVDKQCRKQSAAEAKAFAQPFDRLRAPLCKQDFACEADARKALEAFEKSLMLRPFDRLRDRRLSTRNDLRERCANRRCAAL